MYITSLGNNGERSLQIWWSKGKELQQKYSVHYLMQIQA